MIRRPVPPKFAILKTSTFRPRPRVVPKASLQEAAGHYIGLVVLFTATMNWWHYKQIREEAEAEDDD